MSLTTKLQAVVRRGSAADYAAGDNYPVMNNRGDVSVAQGLPSKTELSRLGRWSVAIATGSAFTPVAAFPTTLANLVLYNGDSTKTFVVDTIWAVGITSIAAATSFTLLAQLSTAGVAAPTNDTAQLITSTSGHGTYAGNAKRAVANTAFAIANKWTVVGQSSGHPSTAIGACAFADVFGGILIPPLSCLGVNLVASTAAGTAIQGIDWYELVLPLPNT